MKEYLGPGAIAESQKLMNMIELDLRLKTMLCSSRTARRLKYSFGGMTSIGLQIRTCSTSIIALCRHYEV
jgi:hypothetical protein